MEKNINLSDMHDYLRGDQSSLRDFLLEIILFSPEISNTSSRFLSKEIGICTLTYERFVHEKKKISKSSARKVLMFVLKHQN